MPLGATHFFSSGCMDGPLLLFYQSAALCSAGVSDAYYCKECTVLEKDRDGCPKIVNLGSSKTDLFYERKKYGFKKR